ncbi:hypothetical protein [Streptomyces sp. NPDC051567]|uniref:hypothetical protein n=1 Tax=Streptomyces sp. NPDC051567 TaxID=3365660 RepID=UPI0037A23712
MNQTITLRAALVGATALLAIGGLVSTATGATALPAGVSGSSPPAVRAGTPASHQVHLFFSDYRRAVLGQSGESPRQVRGRYLVPQLQPRLDAWARRHGADPVFRAQNVPVDWSVRQEAEEHGFASVRLTERWSGGGSRDVWYTVRLGDLRIVEINDRPAF